MIYFISQNQKLFRDAEIHTCGIEDVLNYFKDKKEIQVDTETEGFDPYTNRLLSLQLGTREHQFVIDATTIDITQVKPLLEDKSKVIILHNAKFDLRFLYHKGIIPFGNVFDTYLAEKVLSMGIPTHRRSLDACVRRYLKLSLPKEIRGQIHKRGIYDTSVIKYAATDVLHLQDIKMHQERKLTETDLHQALALDNLFVCALAYVEYCGFKIDVKMWKKKAEQDKEVMLDYKRRLNELVESLEIPEFLTPPDLFNNKWTCQLNWNSEKQLIPLFELLGINCMAIDKKTGEEKKSIEAKVLWPQVDKHPLVSLYLKYQKAQKLVSTYGDSFLEHVNPVSNRIHTQFDQLKNTGRLSSGGNNNVNFQNIPGLPDEKKRKEGKIYERQCFIPEEGNTFAVCDYSSQESRILADFSRDPNLVKFYQSGGADLHSYAAQLVYEDLKDVDLKEIKDKHADRRQIMKGFNFALAYGGNANTVSVNANIPLDIALEAEEKYFNAFSGLRDYFERTKEKTVQDGYVFINKVSKRKSFFYLWDQYLYIRAQLEEMVPDTWVSERRSNSYFKGLSSRFWDYYSYNKSLENERYQQLRSLVSKYFRIAGSFERKGLNYPIQGTAADQSKLAGVLYYQWILETDNWGKILMCAPVHDEWVIEFPKSMGDLPGEKLKECMITAANKFMSVISMNASLEIGPHWDH